MVGMEKVVAAAEPVEDEVDMAKLAEAWCCCKNEGGGVAVR